ncbi:type I-B CRISPR-associated protein Cas8b1/Cst1 [Candidatus Babeliales bacterium]|nr:type I-B CRISPR-associated protein Cas8b1/Cst1 [Candidatus Babeliales bacterium]
MKNEIISNKMTTGFVGDPFVNLGLIAIELLANKDIDDCTTDDLKKWANYLVDLYLTPAWAGELQSIFPNSSYIQFAKGYKRDEKSIEFLHDLIEGIGGGDDEDYCLFCGNPAYKRKDEKPFVKTQIPLIGSSDFVNFFPSFNNGIEICARCALAMQFAPILYYKTGGKPSCVSCNNRSILEIFAKECIDYINQHKALGSFQSKSTSGMFDEGFKSPQNAIFNLAYKVSTRYKRKGFLNGNEEIVIYRIDNYNQNPDGVSIYKIPSNVFRFVLSIMNSPDYKNIWYNLLSKYYRGKEDTKDNLPIWKTNYNTIHDYLLKDRSILWAFRDNKSKKSTVPWTIVEHYMELVRSMNKQRLEGIKNLADKIAICIEETDNKKRVNEISSAKDFSMFKNRLRVIFRDWQKLGKEEPMITYDEYISAVIPDNNSNWKEVQDLIVIRLYEKLHFMLANIDEGDEE